MTRAPSPDSAMARVAKFFADNPDEELRYADLFVKFEEYSEGTLREVVKRLAQKGAVESVHVIRRPERGRMS